MKDRQFMTLLALVVAAGLVMGLIAFRMTPRGSAAVATTATGNATAGTPGASSSSTAGESVDPQPESTQPASDADSQNGEPAPQTKDAPEMQGPTDGDRPGTVTPPASPPADAPTTDAPPQ